MTRLNQFESVFRAADKAVFSYERAPLDHVCLVTDLGPEDSAALAARVRSFLAAVDGPSVTWSVIDGAGFRSVKGLLERVESTPCDLVVTYRHLHSDAWNWPYSLGEYLDVLTQVSDRPVLVVPHPDTSHALPNHLRDTTSVMAVTDHLTGDHRLVSYAAAMVDEGGTLWLTHVEGALQFERYMEAIAKIPEIETEPARELIAAQLLKDPRDYIESCARVLADEVDVQVESVVRMGRRIEEYTALVAEYEVDLLVMNTMDEGQLAMHGLAYPLAVELRHIPILML